MVLIRTTCDAGREQGLHTALEQECPPGMAPDRPDGRRGSAPDSPALLARSGDPGHGIGLEPALCPAPIYESVSRQMPGRGSPGVARCATAAGRRGRTGAAARAPPPRTPPRGLGRARPSPPAPVATPAARRTNRTQSAWPSHTAPNRAAGLVATGFMSGIARSMPIAPVRVISKSGRGRTLAVTSRRMASAPNTPDLR